MFYRLNQVPVLLLLVMCLGSQVLLSQESTYVEGLTAEIHETSNDSIKGHNYISIAQHYIKRDIEKAVLYIDSARSITTFNNSEAGKGLLMLATGELKIQQKEKEEGLNLLKQAKAEFLRIKHRDLQNQVDYKLGAAHLSAGDYLEANESFSECRKYAILTSDSLNLAKAVTALGVIQRRLGNLDQAYEYYLEALPVYIQKNHVDGHSTSLLNLAIIEKQRENFDSSIDFYNQAIEVAERQDPVSTYLLSYIYGNMSSLFNEMKDYGQAIIYGEKGLELRKKSASNEELANSYLGLSINHYHLSNYGQALNYVELAKEKAAGNQNILLNATKAESNIYQKQGRFQKAFSLLKESNVHRDSVYNTDKNKQIAELNTKYETELKESQIAQLSLEDQVNQSRISQQRWALGGSAIGLSVLSFLFYRLFGKNKKIQSQNTIISKSNKEKEVLLKEIHHRVKNNLQVISSLLGLQSLSISDQKTKDALQEGRARVHSMSLIHQNLYQKDNLTGIPMETYIHKLCQDLIRTYNTGECEIRLEERIQPGLILDVESVVPIGLIINELVTNSLKYAFPDMEKGLITVDLRESNNQLILTVSDDGVGVEASDLDSNADSFGLSLIRAFEEKLDAKTTVNGKPSMTVSMEINQYLKA